MAYPSCRITLAVEILKRAAAGAIIWNAADIYITSAPEVSTLFKTNRDSLAAVNIRDHPDRHLAAD